MSVYSLHTSSESKQNGLLLNVEAGSQELVILSYATLCPHPSVSLSNEKNIVKLVKIKQKFVRKMRVYTEWELFGFGFSMFESIRSRKTISVLRHAQ